ncbi:MAG: alpha/beta fold hydrolase [Dehalococcoidia bacterium]|nr:alpha/beta fold hydrolase [Dehalococcoidia bacterium]
MPHVRVNGADLWYEVRGAGEPILLHHGYTASRVNWMPVAERLQDRYQVILMECRGTGESDHTEGGYDIPQYAADVVGVADHLGLDRFTFGGHSMGGGIGYWLALEYPERLERLVLVAAIPADGTGPATPLREAARRRRVERDVDAMLRQHRAMRIRPEVETEEWFADRVRHILECSDGHFDGGARTMSELRAGERLGEIATPTLVIAGAADGLLRANLRDFQRLPNASLHVLNRVGHEVAVHAPDAVADVIADFMEHGVVTAALLMERVRAAEVALAPGAPGAEGDPATSNAAVAT